MNQYTLVLIKPEGVKIKDKIFKKLDDVGKRIKVKYYKKAPMENIKKNYKEHQGKHFHNGLINQFKNKSIITAVYKGDNVIKKFREVIGDKDPAKAAKGTIRSLSKDTLEKAEKEKRAVRNLIHASTTKKTANFELGIWFPEYKNI